MFTFYYLLFVALVILGASKTRRYTINNKAENVARYLSVVSTCEAIRRSNPDVEFVSINGALVRKSDYKVPAVVAELIGLRPIYWNTAAKRTRHPYWRQDSLDLDYSKFNALWPNLQVTEGGSDTLFTLDGNPLDVAVMNPYEFNAFWDDYNANQKDGFQPVTVTAFAHYELFMQDFSTVMVGDRMATFIDGGTTDQELACILNVGVPTGLESSVSAFEAPNMEEMKAWILGKLNTKMSSKSTPTSMEDPQKS